MNETEAHNMAHLNAFLEQQYKVAKTGAECPKCGGGVNPVILENFGHCLACQTATWKS